MSGDPAHPATKPGTGPRVRRPASRDGLYVVGVTGGVASGKSTFVEILAAVGPSFVVHADLVGHDILERPEVARPLAAAFGGDILDSEGRVRRPVLGPRAFASPEALARLNAIVHPPLLARLREILEAQARAGFEGLAILDAALLVEWDVGSWCDIVVAILAPPERQVERLMRNRARSEAEARAIVARQLSGAIRATYADFTLANEGTLAAFEEACRTLAGRIHAAGNLARAGRSRI